MPLILPDAADSAVAIPEIVFTSGFAGRPLSSRGNTRAADFRAQVGLRKPSLPALVSFNRQNPAFQAVNPK